MDDSTKALENALSAYKTAFKYKLDNYQLPTPNISVLDNPTTATEPVQSQDTPEIDSAPESRPPHRPNTPKPKPHTRPTNNENPPKPQGKSPFLDIPKEDEPRTEPVTRPPLSEPDDSTNPVSLPFAPELPFTPISIKPRHIAHRIITSTSIRFSLGLILLLFL